MDMPQADCSTREMNLCVRERPLKLLRKGYLLCLMYKPPWITARLLIRSSHFLDWSPVPASEQEASDCWRRALASVQQINRLQGRTSWSCLHLLYVINFINYIHFPPYFYIRITSKKSGSAVDDRADCTKWINFVIYDYDYFCRNAFFFQTSTWGAS